MKKTYKIGIEMLEEQIAARNKNRELSKLACTELLSLHCVCLGAIKSIYSLFIGEIGKTDESTSARLPLISSFMQGIDICEMTIMEGLYAQSAVLLKQELETVAAVNECCKGTRVNRKTPNAKFVKFSLGKEYGFLNDIGHVSDKEHFEILFKTIPDATVAGQVPVSITPVFNNDLCVRLYAMHILFIVQIIEQLDILYFDMYSYKTPANVKKALYLTYSTLWKEGLLISPEK